MFRSTIRFTIGLAFLIAACLHWKYCEKIQGRFLLEEVPAAEIASEIRPVSDKQVNNLFYSLVESPF